MIEGLIVQFPVWAALYTSASIGLAHAVSRGLGLPVWVTPACAFNNTTSLPLLLLQSLESVGSLKLIIPEGDSMSGAITRAQSYFLLCAVVSKTIGYAVGPKMLQNGNNQDEGRDAQDTDAEAGQSNNGDYADNDEEASEETSLLPERVQKARRKVTGKFRRVGRWVSSFLPERVKQELMAPFESPLPTLRSYALSSVPPLVSSLSCTEHSSDPTRKAASSTPGLRQALRISASCSPPCRSLLWEENWELASRE